MLYVSPIAWVSGILLIVFVGLYLANIAGAAEQKARMERRKYRDR